MLVKVILLFLLMKVLFLLLLDDIINGVVIKGERILLKEYKKCRVLNKLGFFDFYMIIRLVFLFVDKL